MQGWPVTGTQPLPPGCQAPDPRPGLQPFPVGAPGPLTAGRAGAVHRGDPEVGGAGIKDDGEVLRWGANGDGAKVLHLQARVGREPAVGAGDGEGPRGSSVGRAWANTDRGSETWEVAIRGTRPRKGWRGRKSNHYPDAHYDDNHWEQGRGGLPCSSLSSHRGPHIQVPWGLFSQVHGDPGISPYGSSQRRNPHCLNAAAHSPCQVESPSPLPAFAPGGLTSK